MIPERAKKPAAWVVICTSCVAGAEGLREYAYRDPVGIPTICFGETKGVKMGDRATKDECKAMLGVRIEEFGASVDYCVKVPLSPERKAAYVSFAYNIGVTKFCRSTLVTKANMGDAAGSCNELLRWTRAAGIELPGLVKRRQEERKLCLTGIA